MITAFYLLLYMLSALGVDIDYNGTTDAWSINGQVIACSPTEDSTWEACK